MWHEKKWNRLLEALFSTSTASIEKNLKKRFTGGCKKVVKRFSLTSSNFLLQWIVKFRQFKLELHQKKPQMAWRANNQKVSKHRDVLVKFRFALLLFTQNLTKAYN